MMVDESANDTTLQESGVAHPREEGPTTRINMGKGERIASILGGAALALAAVAKRGRVGLGLAMAAGSLLVRGVTGSSLLMRLLGKNRALVSSTGAAAVPHEQGIRVEDSILIERSAGELYHFWRNFTNLPQFMPHLKSVEVYEGNRSHWTVEGPAGTTVQWDAEVINDQPNELIAWRTVEGSVVDHAGTVRFRPTPDGSATMVEVVFEYAPAGGAVGAAVVRLFGRAPEKQVRESLERLKAVFSGGASPADVLDTDRVEQASEESFPASDPPAYY